jgi:NitT/TauT family transport system permease protein
MATVASPTPRRTGMSILWRVVKSPIFARSLFPVAVIVFWLVSMNIITSVWPFMTQVLPTPGEVWSAMWDELRDPFVQGVQAATRENVYYTFGRSLIRLGSGFAIAMTLGTILGLAMGLSKVVDAFFHDWVMAILAMPALVWALFLSLAFGFGHTGPIIAVVLTGIPFVIVNVREGVRNTPRELFDMARSFDVPQSRVTRHVLLPSLMPFMFAAIRYAFSIGWKGLVIAEVFGGQDGAGWTIKFWYDAHRAHAVVGYAFFFIIFALLLEKVVFDPISRRAFKWRPQVGSLQLVEEMFDEPIATSLEAATVSSEAAQSDMKGDSIHG